MSIQGKFVWHDLMSTDPAASRKFYTELLGWQTKEFDMGPGGKYTLLLIGERDFGGIVDFSKSHGAPSHWVPYIAAESVDAVCDKAQSLGGKVCVPAQDIPNVGRFAVVEDPQGAIFSPFKSKNSYTDSNERPVVGTFCWDDDLVQDPAAAFRFYQGLFGYNHEEKDLEPGSGYVHLKAGDQHIGGIMKTPQGAPERGHWLSYIRVEDINATTEKAKSLGARVAAPPREIPNLGSFSVLVDPAGAVVALFQYKA